MKSDVKRIAPELVYNIDEFRKMQAVKGIKLSFTQASGAYAANAILPTEDIGAAMKKLAKHRL